MNVHKNARLTRHRRERIVRQVESGQALEARNVLVKPDPAGVSYAYDEGRMIGTRACVRRAL